MTFDNDDIEYMGPKDELYKPYNDFNGDRSVELKDIGQIEQIMERTYRDLIAQDRLTKDLKLAAQTLDRKEVRYLVDMYYGMQEQRIRAGGQVKASITAEKPEPNSLIAYMFEHYAKLETDMKSALEKYAASTIPGQWAMSVMGIGPVITSGLLCHINVEIAKTSGDVWRYAGMDNTIKWLGKEKSNKLVRAEIAKPTIVTADELERICILTNRKFENLSKLLKEDTRTAKASEVIAAFAKRPWNASLKRLCYLIGLSFVKSSNRPGSDYGWLYQKRKAYEREKNDHKDYADQAAMALELKNFGEDTDARKFYEMGMLPPAHIQMRVQRYVTKIFLSHYFQVAYESQFHAEMPKPWILANQPLVHTHYLPPPKWPIAGFERDFARSYS